MCNSSVSRARFSFNPLSRLMPAIEFRAHGFDVVEIEQHRRMAFDRSQQIGEAAEHMRADRLALIGAGHAHDFVGGNAEMVRPEPDQPFDKADIGIGRGVEAQLSLRLRQAVAATAAGAVPARLALVALFPSPIPSPTWPEVRRSSRRFSQRVGRASAWPVAQPESRTPRAPLRRSTADRRRAGRQMDDQDRQVTRRADPRRCG